MKLIRHPHVVQLYEVCPLCMSMCMYLCVVCAYVSSGDCGFLYAFLIIWMYILIVQADIRTTNL